MQWIVFAGALAAMLAASGTALAQTPSWTPPSENQRCPSKWGAGDERGSANHMKPQTVLNAVKLIKTGDVIELGHVLNTNMPFFGTRRFDKKQNLTLQPGDAVIIDTGWGKLWGKDNARYVKSCPGIGVKAAEWLISKDPMLLGSDNWPVEVAPNPDSQVSLPVHQIALVVNGVHLLENLKLDELAAKGVYEFAFIMEPLKIQGGSGSTVAPIAVR
jgi:kynurenine formamidase